jgi:WD40 repeat protein
MLRRTSLALTLAVAILAPSCDRPSTERPATPEPTPVLRIDPKVTPKPSSSSAAPPPVARLADPLPSISSPARPLIAPDPIVIPDCRLAVIERQDVPSQRDGVLLFICTDIKPGEQVPPDRIATIKVADQERKYRRLKEGDAVEAGQLLGLLDDRLARDDWAIKKSQIAMNEAGLAAAERARDEAQDRYQTQLRLRTSTAGPATSEEDVGGAKLTWYKNHYEAVSRREAMNLAALEFHQAQTVLGMYEIRSSIPGVIKRIHKNPGEAVKSLEPVLEICNLKRLRVEGLVETQHLAHLRQGMQVLVEPTQALGPEQVFRGHLAEVTGVATTNAGGRPVVVSASEDGTIRLWDRAARRELRVLRHPAAVQTVACTPANASANLCLAGCADGGARLWDLNGPADRPVRELKDQHHGAVTCVAFSLDGKWCATGGEDHEICLWDVTTGALRCRLPASHLGAITSVQFLPESRLLSVSRDNTLKLWILNADGARLEATFEHRSGDVARLTASADGTRVLFDQGNALQILSLPQGVAQGILQTPSAATNFTTLALFCPDSRLILTAGASEGGLQLWRTPEGPGTYAPRLPSPGHPLRQLICSERSSITCAAYAPDGTYLVTGSRDRQVMVWPLPTPEEIERRFSAELTLIEQSVESNARQVRICAELPNPDGRLVPGTSVTLIVSPKE